MSDKPAFTTLDQLAAARRVQAETRRIFSVCFSERFENAATVRAGELVQAGAIGRVVHTVGLGPHRLSAPSRPAWFFERARYGGILADIASHQADQFLFFTGATQAEVVAAQVANWKPSPVAGARGLRRDAAARRRRDRLRPGRLVYPRWPRHLGRRPPGDPGHRGLHRAPQVRGRRRAAGRQPPLPGRPERHPPRGRAAAATCPTAGSSWPTSSTGPRPRWRRRTASWPASSRWRPRRRRSGWTRPTPGGSAERSPVAALGARVSEPEGRRRRLRHRPAARRGLPDPARTSSRSWRSATSTRRRPGRSPQAYAVPRVLTDFGALCGLDDLDVVDICTPPYLHCAQTLQALAAGRHVICEKPLAGSLEDADQIAAAEPRSGRRVMPIFQYRFGHGLQKLRWLVEQGVAGRAYLTTVETAWRRRPAYYAVPWRSPVDDRARGPRRQPRDPRPRPRVLRPRPGADRLGPPDARS